MSSGGGSGVGVSSGGGGSGVGVSSGGGSGVGVSSGGGGSGVGVSSGGGSGVGVSSGGGSGVGVSPGTEGSALGDADGSVRVAAATWLATTDDAQPAVDQLAAALDNENWWTRLRAANVLELLGVDGPKVVEQVRKAHEEATGEGNDPIGAGYVARASETILEKISSK